MGDTGTIKVMSVAPGDSNVIYAGGSNGMLRNSTNALAASPSWSAAASGLPARAVTQIAIDPRTASTAYASFSGFASSTGIPGYLFKTVDGGGTWTNVTGNLPVIPVNDLVIDPDLPDTLYAATDIGVKATRDGGVTWTTLGSGLPNVVVHSLKLHRSARVLRAGTHGRSVWEIAVPLDRPSLAPAISSLSPSTANPGAAAFTLTATGTGFVAGTVIRWNGQNRPTQFVDASHVTASIPAGDIAIAGRAAVDAFNASTGGGASVAKAFVIGGPPSSASNAFVGAADPTGGSSLAPRSIASLYGANLSHAVESADAGPPLPFTLADTTVTINGTAAPLFFVSPGQVNLQIPLTGATGNQPLVITHGAQSTTITVSLKTYSPSLFTINQQGKGQAATTIAATGQLAAPAGTVDRARPAKLGEAISVYCTGLGDVNNRPGLGSASPSSPLATTLVQPTVSIGGQNAQVLFSGLAPGYVGLYQVNVVVPAAVTPGSAVSVSLTIGGVVSNTATIAVDPQ